MSFCIYCGFPLKPEDSVCPRCGAQVQAERPEYSAKSDGQTQPPAGETPPPQYMPAGNVGGSYPPPPQQPYGQGGYAPYMTPVQPPEPLSIGTVVGMLVLGNIPLVGWIVMLIWAFDRAPRPNRRNLARGILILKLIGIALVVFFWILIAFLGYSTASLYYTY